MDWSLEYGIPVAVLVFWAVGAYNRLVRLRSAGVQAFSLLESQWHRHLAWIEVHALPVQEAAPGTTVAPSDWSLVLPAMEQFKISLKAAKAQPMRAELSAALSAAWHIFRMACSQTLTPDEAGHARVPDLLAPQWGQLMMQDQEAVEAFNVAVDRYNQAVRQFPARVLAWLFGFQLAGTL